jgi:hypothetical protein
MDSVNMSSLLQAEENKIRTELKADSAIDQNRRQSLDRLNEVLDRVLLRYSAANANDRKRQAVADCQAAAVRDMLGLLLAGTARKEIEKRRFRVGGVICLLLAVICGLISALLIRDYYPAGCILMAAAALFGFLAGRLWYGEREVRVHAELDADVVWKTLKKAVETMDRKSEEYLAQEETWLREQKDASSPAATSWNPETLRLLGDLLEALYAGNGDYALRQLKKLLPWLRQQGIEAVDYSTESADLFELLPTKRASATQRPALVREGTLLLAGRATEHVD